MTAPCHSCGTELPGNAKFCLECGTPVTAAKSAEYKQVTVVFADVVHSMDIAAAVGAERLREIMAELVNRSAKVVTRYGGTVDKFTGDGIMAMFGAPVSLEDHAFRACLAAIGIQTAAQDLAPQIERTDGVTLALRIGLNSGEVIAGDIGSGVLGYTAIGEQVGMAQRMESVAPPGGVMLSESTARLVEDVVVLGEPELVHIKGAAAPASARRLLSISASHGRIGSQTSALVGRGWEVAALTAMLDRAMKGHGCVAGIVGPAGIGKSRIVAETAALAQSRGVPVFSTFCESHTSEVPFHASRQMLRAALGAGELDDETVRTGVRSVVPDADPADLALLYDELGIPDTAVELPDISSDARRRRLTALISTLVLARTTPAVFVIEDAHWIDDTSESLLADFLSVVPQTRALVLVTYRSDYQGVLSRSPGAQTISLAPLEDTDSTSLVAGLLGSDPSVAALTVQITERAAGNPFFAEEIVRDLVGRGVLTGGRGEFACCSEAVVTVPPTLQAAIAARVDRLDSAAKHTLNAAAVIGLRFGDDVLTSLVEDAVIAPLMQAELIDQVKFTPHAEYAFRHPLIRTVAYQSQLKADRAELHRRVADAIEQSHEESVDESASLIAEHLHEAGDLRAAYEWLMRAGMWLTFRNIQAARASWHRARDVADRLPADEPDRMEMRIAPRALACLSAFRAGASVADAGFEELRELTTAVDDKMSLAMGMAGQVSALLVHAQYREASELASEFISLIESIGDPKLMVSLLYAALTAKIQVGEIGEVIRLATRIIELAEGDPRGGNVVIESPLGVALVMRATARGFRGEPGWRDEMEQGLAICRRFAPIGYPVMLLYKFSGVDNSVLADESALRQTAEALEIAERFGDDFTLVCAKAVRGLVLSRQGDRDRADGFSLLADAREAALQGRASMLLLPMIDIATARDRMQTGDLDGAIELSRAAVDLDVKTGEIGNRPLFVAALVEALLMRGNQSDLVEAKNAIEELAEVPVEPDFAAYEIYLLKMRTFLAQAEGDETRYRELADRYRALATKFGYEGHIAQAARM